MSRRVIPKGLITNQARGNKQFNFPLSGVGARGIGLRNAIINRSTNCCPRSGSGGGGGGGGNENFITLEQALSQGGVNSGQILFLDNNRGLVLEDDFTVQNGGFVILANIVNPQGNLPNNPNGIDIDKFAGIFVPENKTLRVLGEIVLGNISSNISSTDKDVYGVYNRGTIEISSTGSITMGDISSVARNAHGIFQESTIQKHTASDSAGAIQMGNITSMNANAFGVKNGQLNDVRVQIGNVSGSGEVAAVNLSGDGDGLFNIGSMSAHVIAGDVTNSGTSFTNGVLVDNLSGSFTCGDVQGDGDVFGIFVNSELSGSATCGNVQGNDNVDVYGITVTTLSGSATCGNVQGNGNVYVTGITVFTLSESGSATCGDVQGNGNVYGIFVNSELSGSATCGDVQGDGDGHVTGINVFGQLSGSATCGDVQGDGNGDVFGIFVNSELSGSATCGNVTGAGSVDGITVTTLTGSATCGNVQGNGNGNVYGIYVFTLSESGSATCGNVQGNGNVDVTGIFVEDTLSGSATCGDVSSTGQSTTNNVIEVTGLRFTIVYPEAKVTIGNISANNGICRGATSTSTLAILAGTTNIGDITYNVDGIDTGVENDAFYSGGFVFKDSDFDQNQNLSDSFVSYYGVGKGLEFEVLINNDEYQLTNTNFLNTTGYAVNQTIVINGEFFGGSQNNNVDLRITSVDNDGQIQGLEIDSTNSGSPPTNPRVTTTDIITTNGLSGSFSVGNIKHTGTATTTNYASIAYVSEMSGKITGKNISADTSSEGITVTTLSGSATCGNVQGNGNGDVTGIYVVNTLSGSATCGDVEGTDTIFVFGIDVFGQLSGSATCGNVEGTGDVFGITVTTLSGSATCGNVTGAGSVDGITVDNTLSGSATCGNVQGDGNVAGIFVDNTLSGSATCGNVQGDGNVAGIYVSTLSGSATCGDVQGDGNVAGIYVSTLSGSFTCGDVQGTGIGGGAINGNVIIKSARIGVANLGGDETTPGTGKVIIGDPGNGDPGTVDNTKLAAYIYGDTTRIPIPTPTP